MSRNAATHRPTAAATPAAGPVALLLAAGLLAAGLLAAGLLAAQPLAAQTDDPLARSDRPLSIEAEGGVEWRRKEKVYIARGNATARQGKTSIRADELTAHYRTDSRKRDRIWKVAATGNVRIATAKETATAQSATYTVESGVFLLRGGDLRLANGSQTITATERIEYRRKERRVHVVGNAKVVDGERVIRASSFVAWLKDAADNRTALRRVEARGGVIITTATEIIRADRGDYDNESRVATLTGNVRLTRCDNQLNGDRAVVDLKSGVSRMVGQAKVLLVPGNRAQGCKQG